MSFDLNPARDLNLSLNISAPPVGGGEVTGGQTRRYPIPDLQAADSLNRLTSGVLTIDMAWMSLTQNNSLLKEF